MTCFIVELRGEELRYLHVSRMNTRQEARRHVKRGKLILGQKGHDLPERSLEGGCERSYLIPGYVARGVPLSGNRLVIELRHFGRCDTVAFVQRKRILRAAGLYLRATRRKPARGIRVLGH